MTANDPTFHLFSNLEEHFKTAREAGAESFEVNATSEQLAAVNDPESMIQRRLSELGVDDSTITGGGYTLATEDGMVAGAVWIIASGLVIDPWGAAPFVVRKGRTTMIRMIGGDVQ